MSDDNAAALARSRERVLKSGRSRPDRPTRPTRDSHDPHAEAGERMEEERKAWRERQAAKKAAGGGGGDGMGGEMMDGEDQMIQKGRDLQTQNKESLQNTLRVAQEATQVGAETINKLDAQTEQFLRMDDSLDQTNSSITRSERVIKGMKSLGGAFVNLFTSAKKEEKSKHNITDVMASSSSSSSSSGSGGSNSSRGGKGDKALTKEQKAAIDRDVGGKMAKGKFTAHEQDEQMSDKTKAALSEFERNQADEDAALDEIGNVIDQLKAQSQDMNQKLEMHGQMIDHLGNRIDTTSGRIKHANKEIKKIT